MRNSISFILTLVFAILLCSSTAFAAPNPGDAKEIKTSPSEKDRAQPKKAEDTEKSVEWLEVTVSLAYGYDDNVVLLNQKKELVDDYDTTKIVTTVTLRATPFVTKNWKFGAQYDFYNAMHDEVEYQEIQTHSFLIFGFFNSSPNYFYLPLSTNLYFLDGDSYLQTVRFMPTYYREQGNNFLLSITAGMEVLGYKQVADEAYDGKDYQFKISEIYMFSKESWFKASLGYNYLKTDDDETKSYSGPKLGLSYNQTIFWGIAGEISYNFHYRNYRLADPITDIGRVDKRHSGTLKLSRELKYGISVFGRYTMIVNSSNVERYHYHREILLFGFEWNY